MARLFSTVGTLIQAYFPDERGFFPYFSPSGREP